MEKINKQKIKQAAAQEEKIKQAAQILKHEEEKRARACQLEVQQVLNKYHYDFTVQWEIVMVNKQAKQ